MTCSKSEIYLHFVWATHRRLPLIAPALEGSLHAFLTEEASRVGCGVLAVNGLADHVHLLVRMPAKRCPSQLMQQVKGASSAWGRQVCLATQPLSAEPFGWQDGYGVFSLSRSYLGRVTAYVESQKTRHAADRLWSEWEEADEEC